MDLYLHSDYRAVIKAYYEAKKREVVGFSLRYLSDKAGINSSAFFKFVIEGKRNLSKQHIPKVCAALDLVSHQAEYFEALVHFNQAKTVKEKNRHFAKLVELRNRTEIVTLQEDRFDYFGEWYHPVVRELAASRDFGGDFGKLGRMLVPAISAKEAKDSLRLLLRLGFLKEVDAHAKTLGGKFVQTEPKVATVYGVKSHHVINYQIKMLQLAIEAFDRFSPHDRLTTSTNTLRLSGPQFDQFLAWIKEFQTKLLDAEKPDGNPDEIYQLNINLFPLTKTPRRGPGENEGERHE